MPLAPAAKAIIVISSLAVAAGVALYESESAREDIAEWFQELRQKTSSAWKDLLHEVSERFNLSPEERRRRAEEIMLVVGRRRRSSGNPTGAAGDADGQGEDERARKRRELFELANRRGEIDVVPDRAVRAAAILKQANESGNVIRRRNQAGPFVDEDLEAGVVPRRTPQVQEQQQDLTNVGMAGVIDNNNSDSTIATRETSTTNTAPLTVALPSPHIEEEHDDDTASSTSGTLSFSQIYTPTSSEFGSSIGMDEDLDFESAVSGVHTEGTWSVRSSSPLHLHNEDDILSDAGTETAGEDADTQITRPLLSREDYEQVGNASAQSVSSLSSYASGHESDWSEVSQGR